MGAGESAWDRLGQHQRETQIIASIQSTLYWDQNTRMPPGGAPWRGEQLTLLATQLHARQSSPAYSDLVKQARLDWQVSDRCPQRGRNLDLIELELKRQQALDPALVAALAKAKSEGYNSWQQARATSDFSLFAPSLQRLVRLRQEQVQQLNESRSCWETLAQPFEPDLTLDRLRALFTPLRAKLQKLVCEVTSGKQSESLSWDLSESAQQQLGDQLLKSWGWDQSITCLARSPHPFSITLGPGDFRITTRVVNGQPLSCFLAVAHEAGHSLYEQALPNQSHQWFAWPLGQATSMSIHESQSLFWENRIARSRAFSSLWWKHFAEAGAPLHGADDLWRAMNPMAPGPNRVESDELTYGLHIMIRSELEIALLEEGMPVEDLPHQWNQKYKDLLGVTPADDAEGCLQDVHWSEGLFGYFPSYLLGHLVSAQLSETMTGAIGKPEDHVLAGDMQPVKSWLNANVHSVGRSMNAFDLVEKVTGRPLTAEPFLAYLEGKTRELAS